MRLVLTLLLFLLSSTALGAEDTAREIVLKTGEVVVGFVVEETDDGLRVRLDGAVVEIPYESIRYVKPMERSSGESAMPPRIDEVPVDAPAPELHRLRHDPTVEPWRRAARGVGLGLGIPLFTVGIGVAAAASPTAGSGSFYGLRTTGTLLMGGFLPAALTGAALSRVALEASGGTPEVGALPVVLGGTLYGVGLGMMMVALDWPAFTTPWVVAPVGFASIPMLIVGAVALCTDIDRNTRIAHESGMQNLRRRRDAALIPVPWVSPTAGGAAGGVLLRF